MIKPAKGDDVATPGDAVEVLELPPGKSSGIAETFCENPGKVLMAGWDSWFVTDSPMIDGPSGCMEFVGEAVVGDVEVLVNVSVVWGFCATSDCGVGLENDAIGTSEVRCKGVLVNVSWFPF